MRTSGRASRSSRAYTTDSALTSPSWATTGRRYSRPWPPCTGSSIPQRSCSWRRRFSSRSRSRRCGYSPAGRSAAVASAVGFDFHEVAFAPVLIAVALERLAAGRLRTALIALAALLLVKEDMGFLVAGIGIYLAVARPRVVKRQLLVAVALVVVGLADSVLATYVLIPA